MWSNVCLIRGSLSVAYFQTRYILRVVLVAYARAVSFQRHTYIVRIQEVLTTGRTTCQLSRNPGKYFCFRFWPISVDHPVLLLQTLEWHMFRRGRYALHMRVEALSFELTRIDGLEFRQCTPKAVNLQNPEQRGFK